MLTDFKEFFAAGEGGVGVAEVETAEGIDDNFGDDEAGVFFVVGGDDIPGSGGGAGGAEGSGIGVLVVIPVAALLDVGEAEFPVFLGLVDAGEEALALFCFGEVEEEFEDAGAVAVEVGFVVVDGGVAVGPDIGDGVGEALGAEETGVDAHDENLLVVGAIEDADLAAGGEVGLGAPEEVVGKFLGGGLFEAGDVAALRVNAGHDVADGAVFASGVHGLEDEENGVATGGVVQALQVAERIDLGLEEFFVGPF